MELPGFFRPLEKIAALFALFAGGLNAILAILIAFDIVARSLFRYSLQGTDELGGYTLALIGSLGLSQALLRRGHPRIDIFMKWFPKWVQALLHVLAYALMAGFAIFMTVHAAEELQQTIQFGTITNTPLQTPLWLPQILWVIGTGFFALTASVCALHALWLFTRNAAQVNAVYGPLTVEDEIHDYIGETPPSMR